MLITNGKDEKNVTKGVYKQYYEHLGYHPVIKVGYEEPDIKMIEEPKVDTIEESKVEKIEKKEKIVSRKNTPKKSKK